MADEQAPETTTESPKAKRRWLPIIVVAAIMLGEGAAIFILASAMKSGPAAALAGEGAGSSGTGPGARNKLVEVALAECRPSNKMSGKFVTFQIRVLGLVAAEDFERAQELVESRKARLEDGVNIVIRSAEPKQLNEPDLSTLRRRLRQEFGRIFDDPDLIKQVLIPSMLQSGPGV